MKVPTKRVPENDMFDKQFTCCSSYSPLTHTKFCFHFSWFSLPVKSFYFDTIPKQEFFGLNIFNACNKFKHVPLFASQSELKHLE